MGKINITKPTGGVDTLNLISAFKGDNNIYVVFDSEKTGTMGLPIILVSKYTDKLEKIDDANEWQSCKNYLKGIINGTNFEYVKIPDQVTANEAYYIQLSLPNQASFDAIKNRYVVNETQAPTSTPEVAPSVPETLESAPVATPTEASVSPSPITPEPPKAPETIAMPNPEVVSNPEPEAPMSVPVVNEVPTNVVPTEPIIPASKPQSEPEVAPKTPVMDFSSDKDTFLKACENMFDALISKYQKELSNLEAREAALEAKEKDIAQKLESADEHLKNAAAREQVANIAHDNASKIVDINSLMPTNPENPS